MTEIPEACSYPEGLVRFTGGHTLSAVDAVRFLREIAAMEPGDVAAVWAARIAVGWRQKRPAATAEDD